MVKGNKMLGGKIKKARKAAGITQEEMAERLGISLMHYGRLERAERRASFEQVERIAQILVVSPYELLDGCLMGEARPAFDCDDICGMMERLALMLQGCTPEERELCFDLCERIACGKKK